MIFLIENVVLQLGRFYVFLTVRVIKLRPFAEILEEQRRERLARLEQLAEWRKCNADRPPRP